MAVMDLSGLWACEIPGQAGTIRIPGTLDEAGIGFPDPPEKQWKAEEVSRIGFYRDGDPIVTRLTRKVSFEGAARITRHVSFVRPAGARVFADVERARGLRLTVNGVEVQPVEPGCLSAPWSFEVTEALTGEDEFCFISDNSYPGWPRDAIVYSSAASDETQTNWNGLLGFVRLRTERPAFIASLRVLPMGNELTVVAELDAAVPWQGTLRLSSDALLEPAEQAVSCPPGRTEICFEHLAVRPDAARWDLGEGNLQSLTAAGDGLEEKTVRFGLRDFGAREGCLVLNGRRFFLRGEANCAVFPETGYCPMEEQAWREVLQRYQAYGVNCMRFHSHCPPEAAFAAADGLGMLMQPELSHWDPEHAFASREARDYYENELMRILKCLANHPSFVMLTFGNELHADEDGHRFMDRLLRKAREADPTRLYANGSNTHYGQMGPDPESGFFTASDCFTERLRATVAGPAGWLNERGPDFRTDYGAGMARVRQTSGQPVFSFEVGQYEVLPDFGEIGEYHGVAQPENLRHIRNKVREKGLEAGWERRVEATGELSLLCYRAEVEAALRTEGFSGISLLGLQDFPGQGTALVGMMNAHLQPKPYAFADPSRFSAFFRDTLPLALLPRVTFRAGETLRVPVKIAHYGKTVLRGIPSWQLADEHGTVLCGGELPPLEITCGGLADAGEFCLETGKLPQPAKLVLTVSFAGMENTYSLWNYPDRKPVCPPGIHEYRRLDEDAMAVLKAGGKVYLAPDSTEEALPGSVKAQFSTDFWSLCTFPEQAGCMGQLIEENHPLFERFPTAFHTDWQWWPMAGQRAFVLPKPVKAIVEEMDSYAFLRPMAQLFEGRCAGGKLMVSSLGLHRLREYPEAQALQQAIYDYMDSDRFSPEQELDPAMVRGLVP